MMIDLEEVAVALDAFPHWDAQQRAEVFHAIDVAPSTVSEFPTYDQYCESEAGKSWARIRTYVLQSNDGQRWAVTLEEAAGYEGSPFKEDLVKALHRGAGMIG